MGDFQLVPTLRFGRAGDVPSSAHYPSSGELLYHPDWSSNCVGWFLDGGKDLA